MSKPYTQNLQRFTTCIQGTQSTLRITNWLSSEVKYKRSVRFGTIQNTCQGSASMGAKNQPFKWAPLPSFFTRPSPHTVPFNKTVAHYLSSNPFANGTEPEHPTPWLKINRITYQTPLRRCWNARITRVKKKLKISQPGMCCANSTL